MLVTNGSMNLMPLGGEVNGKQLFLRTSDGTPIVGSGVVNDSDDVHWACGVYGLPATFSTTEDYLKSLKALIDETLK